MKKIVGILLTTSLLVGAAFAISPIIPTYAQPEEGCPEGFNIVTVIDAVDPVSAEKADRNANGDVCEKSVPPGLLTPNTKYVYIDDVIPAS